MIDDRLMSIFYTDPLGFILCDSVFQLMVRRCLFALDKHSDIHLILKNSFHSVG